MTDSTAARLLGAARIFLERDHPTFEDLDRLQAAVDACDAMKICGHLEDEDCECLPEATA